MVQLLLRGAPAGTQCIEAQLTDDVGTLKQSIQELTGIPAALQGLVYAGRQLQDDTPLHAAHISGGSTVQIVYRLLGGKGGFGALLRGQGRDGKVTDNFDACRDLHGRRLRHKTAEEKLAAWKASAKERELEQIALRHIKEEAKKARKVEVEKVDVEAIKAAQQETIISTQKAVQDALNSSSSAGPSTSKAAGAAVPAGGAKRKAEGAAPGAAGSSSPPKKSKMLAMLEEISSDDDDDEDSA